MGRRVLSAWITECRVEQIPITLSDFTDWLNSTFTKAENAFPKKNSRATTTITNHVTNKQPGQQRHIGRFGCLASKCAVAVLNGCRRPLPDKQLSNRIANFCKPLPFTTTSRPYKRRASISTGVQKPLGVTTDTNRLEILRPIKPLDETVLAEFGHWLKHAKGMTDGMTRCRIASIRTIQRHIDVPLSGAKTDDILSACVRVQTIAAKKRVARGSDCADDRQRRVCYVAMRILCVMQDLLGYPNASQIIDPLRIDFQRINRHSLHRTLTEDICLDRLPATAANGSSARRQPCNIQVQAMMAACQTPTEHLVVLLLTQTGLRSRALREIPISRVWCTRSRTARPDAYINEKNGSVRHLLLEPHVRAAITRVVVEECEPLLQAHNISMDASTPLFLIEYTTTTTAATSPSPPFPYNLDTVATSNLRAMSRGKLYTMLGCIAERACIDRRRARWLTPHAFRRYLGSEMSACGNSNEQISRFFHHASMHVTRRHYNVSPVKDQVHALNLAPFQHHITSPSTNTETTQLSFAMEDPNQQNSCAQHQTSTRCHGEYSAVVPATTITVAPCSNPPVAHDGNFDAYLMTLLTDEQLNEIFR